MTFKQIKLVRILLLPALIAGNTSVLADVINSQDNNNSLKKQLVAAIASYAPKTTNQPIFQFTKIIHKRVKEQSKDELDAHEQTRKFIEDNLSKITEQPSVEIKSFDGEVKKENLNDFIRDIVFEMQVPISIIQCSIEEQLDSWQQNDINEELQEKIRAAKYSLLNIQKIALGLKILKWLANNNKNKLQEWLTKTSQYKKGEAAFETLYRQLKAKLENPEDEPTGEMFMDMLTEQFKSINLTPDSVQMDTDEQKLATEILEDLQKAAGKTQELYEYAFNGITAEGEDKEEKITALIVLLNEIFQELETFESHVESGLKELVRKSETRIKRGPNNMSQQNLMIFKEALNILKMQRTASWVADLVLDSKFPLFTFLRRYI